VSDGSAKELIDRINNIDMHQLSSLADEVELLATELIEADNLDEALAVMGCYTEVEWEDYPGADGYWLEHTDIVELLLLLGEQDQLENPNLIISNTGNRFPHFYRVGVTINPNLEIEIIDEWMEVLSSDDNYSASILKLGLLLNSNLNYEIFVKHFEQLNSQDINYILDIVQGHSIYDGSDQFAFEFLSQSDNSILGRKRIIAYILNNKDDLVTQQVRFINLEVGSKDEFLNRWSSIDISVIQAEVDKGIAIWT
jgi:hypothetical protein